MKTLILSIATAASAFAGNVKPIIDAQFHFDDPQIITELVEIMIQGTGSKKSVQECTNELLAAYNEEAVQKKLEEAFAKRFSPEQIAEIEQLVTSDLFKKYTGELYRFTRDVTPLMTPVIMAAFTDNTPAVATETKMIEATADTLDEIIESHSKVVLDIYSTYCPPCKTLAPILDQLSMEKEGYTFVKINSDKYPAVAQRLKVRGVPTLLFYKDGVQVHKNVGFIDKDPLVEMLTANLD
jgi:thioredoxin 1